MLPAITSRNVLSWAVSSKHLNLVPLPSNCMIRFKIAAAFRTCVPAGFFLSPARGQSGRTARDRGGAANERSDRTYESMNVDEPEGAAAQQATSTSLGRAMQAADGLGKLGLASYITAHLL